MMMRSILVSLLLSVACLCLLPPMSRAANTPLPDDDHESCPNWADQGECEDNPTYMLTHCATSCDRWLRERNEAAVELANIKSFFELSAYDIDGQLFEFEQLRGQVTVVTNVASYCGYTAEHYKQMVELWSQVYQEGVQILAFPCNQFGQQEPGTAHDIKQFALEKGVLFRMMSKINVNGPEADIVYKFLKKEAGPSRIAWNFGTYFVVGPDGGIQSLSGVEPMELKPVIMGLLKDEL